MGRLYPDAPVVDTQTSAPTTGGRLYGPAAAVPQPAPKQSFLKRVVGAAKGVGKTLIGSEKVLGESVAGAIGGNLPSVKKAQGQAQQAAAQESRVSTLLAHRTGTAVPQLPTTVADATAVPGSQYTKKQVVGAVAGTALDALSAGTYGEAAKGARTGKFLFKRPSVVKTVAEGSTKGVGLLKGAAGGFEAGAKSGLSLGAAYGVAQGLQENKSAKDVLVSGLKGSLVGAATGGATGAVAGGISGRAKAKALLPDKATQNTWDMIQPTLSKTEQAQAVTEGRITTKGPLGTIRQIPKERDIQMIEAAKPYVAKAKNPIEAVSNMQSGIADEATKLRTGLEKSGAIWNKNTLKGAINGIERPDLIASDPVLNGAYDRINARVLKSAEGAPKTLDGLLTVRQELDTSVKKQYPRLYDDPRLTPLKQAIMDIRTAINEQIASQLPDGKTIDGITFKHSLRKQSLLYDAIDNAASKVEKVGTNRLGQFLKAHPTAAKVGAAVVGGGIAGSAIKEVTGL